MLGMSSASAIQAGLKACKLFHGLDDKAVQHIAEKAVIQKQSAGTHLILPGDKLSAMYVVLKGWVKVYRINENGEEAITCLFGPKDSLLGDLLFYSHPSPVGAQTETEAELIQISVEAMRQLMSAYPTLG
ncbi:MAG TPA: cyclic nucleotide-binding domain-containing protein, partial [Alphaproteobacteria bacterium]|nr:cyclic nucleotide-binding domain-containing protein [Alphaproteobacteria bacterium]